MGEGQDMSSLANIANSQDDDLPTLEYSMSSTFSARVAAVIIAFASYNGADPGAAVYVGLSGLGAISVV
jgi:hypothetical protein